jgi:preprotein translocase subunit SecA
MILHRVPPLIASLYSSSLAVDSQFRRRQLWNYTKQVRTHASRFALVKSEAKLDTEIERLREHVHLISSSAPPAADVDQPDHRLHALIPLARRTKTLLRTADEASLACEALGLAAVLMERTLGKQLHDNQLAAGLALAQGRIIQLDTGEGKTFVGALRVFLDHLWGLRTMVVVPNNYLAVRDSRRLTPFYQTFGLRIGCADGTPEDGPDRWAYRRDVCYVSLPHLMSDYLSHVNSNTIGAWVTIPCQSVLIDEVDAVLLDSPPYGQFVWLAAEEAIYYEADLLARTLRQDTHFRAPPYVQFTDEGYAYIAQHLDQKPHLARLALPAVYFYLNCALRAQHHLQRDADYIVFDNKVIVIDQHTGRRDAGRSLGQGIQQAVEVKEGVSLSTESEAIYSVFAEQVIGQATYLSGMSGSAATERNAFRAIYGLPVLVLPPNRPSQRKVWPDELFATRQQQFSRVVELTAQYHNCGRPVLINAQSIMDAQEVAVQLQSAGLDVELITAKNDVAEADIMERAGEAGAITVAARMAGRGVDIVVDSAAQAAGGLAVICAGRFLVRRLDDQIAGRTGRQGAPGDVHFILSLDDSLLEFAIRQQPWVKTTIKQLSNMQNQLTMPDLSLRMAQSQYSHKAFGGLWRWIMNGRLLTEVRAEYESRRYAILGSTNCDDLVHEALAQAHAERLLDTVVQTYQAKKASIGVAGRERERLILLKVLDYQWALLYIDWTRHLENQMFLSDNFVHHAQFIGERARNFCREFALQAAHYLLAIDEPQVLQSCYYWKGTMLLMLPADAQPTAVDSVVSSSMPDLTEVPIPPEQVTIVPPLPDPMPKSPLRPPASPPPPTPSTLLMHDATPWHYRRRLRDIVIVLGTAATGVALLFLIAWSFTGNQTLRAAGEAAAVRPASLRLLFDLDWTMLMRTLSGSIVAATTLVLIGLGFDRLQRSLRWRAYPLLLLASLVSGVAWGVGLRGSPLIYLDDALFCGVFALVAGALLRSAGLRFVDGLAFVSGIVTLSQIWPYMQLSARIITIGAALVLAASAILIAARFELVSFRGWRHGGAQHGVMQQRFVVGILDDALALAIAWLWVVLARLPLATLLSEVRFFPLAQSALISALYCLAVCAVAYWRSQWKANVTLYQALSLTRNATFSINNKTVGPAQIRRRNWIWVALGWALVPLVLATTLAWLLSPADPLVVPYLLTLAGLIGMPLGKLLRMAISRWTGNLDVEQLKQLLLAPQQPPTLRTRYRAVFRAAGGVVTCATLTLILMYELTRRFTQ